MDIKSDHIVQFSGLKESEELFPVLIRKLIYASDTSLTKVFFRDGKGTNLSGYDGEASSCNGGLNVPQGDSVWELGSAKANSKADEEYEKRTNDPLHVDLSSTTFIYVTLQRWQNKDSWVATKQAKQEWADVQALDADSLASWIDGCPAVKSWFLAKLGRPNLAVISVEQFVERWEAQSIPRIPISTLLISRQSDAQKMRGWIKSTASALFIRGYDENEGVAFLCAVVMDLPEPEREALIAKTVIFNDEEHLNIWTEALNGNPHIFVRNFSGGSLSQLPVTRGHHFLISSQPQDKPTKDKSILLKKIDLKEMTDSLNEILKLEDLESAVLKSGGQISVLRRLLGPSTAPAWANSDSGKILIPLLLIGTYNTKGTDYIKAIKTFNYTSDQMESDCKKWIQVFEPPVTLKANTYSWISRYDSWVWLSGYITGDQVKAFRTLAVDVLGKENPVFDLPKEERFYADIRKVFPEWGDQIKNSISETLCLISVKADSLDCFRDTEASYFTDSVVKEVLKPNWKTWATLSHQLPVLAEAAPDVFLDCLEKSLSDPNGAHKMFEEEENTMMGSSPHTGLLWALERVAWSPQYLARSTQLFLKLIQLDPGGKIINRPKNSLRSIFLSWLPQTEASSAIRIQILKNNFSKFPQEIWDLMISLIPNDHEIGSNNASPQWRDWKKTENRRVLRKDIYSYLKDMTDFMVQQSAARAEYQLSLLENIERIHPDYQKIVVEQLTKFEASDQNAELRIKIWTEIREVLNRTQSFGRQLLQPEILANLKQLYQSLTPKQNLEKYLWLFSNNPQLPEGRDEDWKKTQEETQNLRDHAVQEILRDADKLKSVMTFVDLAENGYSFSFTVHKMGELEIFSEALEKYEPSTSKRTFFLRHCFDALMLKNGIEWAKENILTLQKAGRIDLAKNLCLGLAFEQESWDFIASLGSDFRLFYWKNVEWFRKCKDLANAVEASLTLSEVGRFDAGIVALANARQDGFVTTPDVLVKTLNSMAEHLNATDFGKADVGSLHYYLGEVFKALDKVDEQFVEQLAMLEWRLFPLFKHSPQGFRALPRYISANPAIFAELVGYAYKPDDHQKSEEPLVLTDQEKVLADISYGFLDKWDDIPFLGENPSENKFKSWFATAVVELKKKNRLRSGYGQLGKLLANSPFGSDGAWPHEAVRFIIDETAKEEMDHGFHIEVFNSRGVVTKSIGEGGKQERELASSYEGYAKTIQNSFPRTAKVLSEIAKGYMADAKREDVRAEYYE